MKINLLNFLNDHLKNMKKKQNNSNVIYPVVSLNPDKVYYTCMYMENRLKCMPKIKNMGVLKKKVINCHMKMLTNLICIRPSNF